MKPQILRTMLREELAIRKYPFNGSHAYHQCFNIKHPEHCGCEFHAASCALNGVLLWFEQEILKMARKKSQQTFEPVTFVRFELTAEDKKAYAKWAETMRNNVDDLVTEVLQANHKISWSFNGQTDSFITSVTGKQEDCINASRCYTSHAKDYFTSLMVALYKYHVIWKRGVWEEVDSEADFG